MTRTYRRFHGHKAGQKAIAVYRCRGCGVHHTHRKPAQCQGCGRMDFDHFPSTGEANHYAHLLLLEKAGEISDVRRQVAFPLYTIDSRGQPVKVADYIADYTYIQNGELVIGDWKPTAGVDPLAALKLRMMELSGKPVKIITTEGST